MSGTQKISTCLWFDTQAEEAANFYVSLFENSRVKSVNHYGKGAPMPEGTVLTVTFELAGTEFMALNGGPHFTFSEASSMVVKCDSQVEIDRLWTRLLEGGGREQQCGWLKDRFGLPWQIVPSVLGEMMQDEDADRTNRVMAALMQMVKLDIRALERAYRQ